MIREKNWGEYNKMEKKTFVTKEQLDEIVKQRFNIAEEVMEKIWKEPGCHEEKYNYMLW